MGLYSMQFFYFLAFGAIWQCTVAQTELVSKQIVTFMRAPISSAIKQWVVFTLIEVFADSAVYKIFFWFLIKKVKINLFFKGVRGITYHQ